MPASAIQALSGSSGGGAGIGRLYLLDPINAAASAGFSLPETKNEGTVEAVNLLKGFALDTPVGCSATPHFNASPGQVATHEGCLLCCSLSRQKLHFCMTPVRPY
jgi:hypothetical protein